jgi:uncharacterized RDD family membrane protein YckC
MISRKPEEAILKESLIGHYAGFTSRLIAFIVDIIIISAVIMFATWFISTTLEMLQVKLFLATLAQSNAGANFASNYAFVPIIASIISILFIVGYHVFFWHIVGQTPGKAIMGIRIVPLRGGKLPLWRAFFRYFGYTLSAIFLGLGFLWILVDDRRMAWHDKLAGTCVIYIWDAHPDETFLTHAKQQFFIHNKSQRSFTPKLPPGKN